MIDRDKEWLACVGRYSDFLLALLNRGDTEHLRRALRMRMCPKPRSAANAEVEAATQVPAAKQ